jgi:hypothetical protein
MLALVGAWWMGRDEAPVGARVDTPPPPAVATDRQVPAPPVAAAGLLVQVATSLVAAERVALRRLEMTEGRLELLVEGHSRNALAAWADRFTAQAGPRWQLGAMAIDDASAAEAGWTASLTWNRHLARAEPRRNILDARVAEARLEEFHAGLARVARWSVVARLDVDTPPSPGATARASRPPEASVDAVLTWAELRRVVSDMEGWAEVVHLVVLAGEDDTEDGLRLTARLWPRDEDRPAADASAAQSDTGDTLASPFVAPVQRNNQTRADEGAEHERPGPSDAGAVVGHSGLWQVQGVVQTAAGWWAAVRHRGGETRVVRVGDRLGSEGQVVAVSWDGVHVGLVRAAGERPQPHPSSGDRR